MSKVRKLGKMTTVEMVLEYVRMLRDLIRSPDITMHLSDAIERPHADRRFSDTMHLPDMPDDPDDQAVPQDALALE